MRRTILMLLVLGTFFSAKAQFEDAKQVFRKPRNYQLRKQNISWWLFYLSIPISYKKQPTDVLVERMMRKVSRYFTYSK